MHRALACSLVACVALAQPIAAGATQQPAYAMLPNGGYVAFDPSKPLFIVTSDEKGRPLRYVLKPGSRELVLDMGNSTDATAKSGYKDFYPDIAVEARSSRLYSRTPYDDIIQLMSQRHGLDVALVKAVIHTESGFNPKARSPKSAMGLMQLIPDTARRFGVNDAYDPVQNIAGGTQYLSELINMFDGNVAYALAGYNAGEHRVKQYGGIPPFEETQHYVRRVMSLARQYGAI